MVWWLLWGCFFFVVMLFIFIYSVRGLAGLHRYHRWKEGKNDEKTRISDGKCFILIYEPMFVFHFWAETIDHLPLPVLILIYYTSSMPYRLFSEQSSLLYYSWPFPQLFYQWKTVFRVFISIFFILCSCFQQVAATIFGDCTENWIRDFNKRPGATNYFVWKIHNYFISFLNQI